MKVNLAKLISLTIISILMIITAIYIMFNHENERTKITIVKKIKPTIMEMATIQPMVVAENKDGEMLFSEDLDTSFMAYMDYRTITSKASNQYKIQQDCYTDRNGFRRYEDLYVIALGSYWGNSTGYKVKVTLSSGESFNAIVGDLKQDIHTNETNQYKTVKDNLVNVVEFIVDTDKISEQSKLLGSMETHFNGKVINIEIL